MASNGASTRAGGAVSSLEKIKRQLASGSGKTLLQGPLLKRSETDGGNDGNDGDDQNVKDGGCFICKREWYM